MKTGTSLLTVIVALVLVAVQFASAITLDRVAGAAVRSVPPFCFTNYNGTTQTGGAYPPLNGDATHLCGGIVMIKFDLSAYTGKFIDGDGDLAWRANWSDPTWPVTFSVRQVLSNWNQALVTWDNWIVDQTGTTWQAFLGPEMFRLQIPGTAGWPGPLCHFAISNSVVQQWTDTPAQNYGVALVPVDLSGNVSANGNVTWFAPAATWRPQEDRGQLSFNLLTTNNPPARPTNQTPTNASFGKPLTLTLTSSPYSDPEGNPQTSSWWQFSTRSDFSATVWESGETTTSKTNLVVPVGALKYATRYFWRVKYKDNAGDISKWSEYSNPTYFDTQLNLIDPVVVIESQSAMIRPGVFADTNVNGGTVSEFNLLNSTTNIAPAGFNMYWFDTRVYSMYTGLVVSANGSLAVSTGYALDPIATPTFELHQLNSAWQETNVTWNNYVGPDSTLWGNQLGPVLSTMPVDQVLQTFTWDVPAAVIQSWLTSPTNNNGVTLTPPIGTTGNVSMKTRRTTPPPTLTFDITYAGAPTPLMPTNVAPANGAHVDPAAVALSASAYNDPSATPQVASQWQIAFDSNMQDIIWDSGASTSALSSVSVPAGVLTNTTRYYWHVRYINQLSGKSSYSAATYFDTPIVGGVIVKRAAQTAMIMYTDPTQNWNSAANLTFNMLNPSNGVAGGPIMLWFDLGVFQGQGGILASNPAVSVQLNWVEQIVALNFELHEILAPWSENSVTWTGFVGPDPATLTNLLLGPSLAVQQLPVEVGSTCTWAFSETVIQNILDGVTTNYGFAIVPMGGGNAQVYSRQNLAKSPYLTVDIVPEPLAGATIVLCALCLLRRRRT